jgi:polysaccharide pyruvyl transferase WcaK-like protein
MKERAMKHRKIAFFGHFDSTNFGNESSLKAILYNFQRREPTLEIMCICTGPEITGATYNIQAIAVVQSFARFWRPRARTMKLLRKFFIGLLGEPYQWARCMLWLWNTDILIVPGTGLITDAYGLLGWGPYNLFKWSVTAKICRCKVFFVSIGAGPLYGTFGRCLAKSLLHLGDFRSYRDESTKQYLNSIGFRAVNDAVYPDLAFSLPETVCQDVEKRTRAVVGIGVMEYAGKYADADPREEVYLRYLGSLVTLVEWLLSHGYDVRLLSGDLADIPVRQQFKKLLGERLANGAEGQIIDEPISSLDELCAQIAATNLVVATRFHNVLLSLLGIKPVISVSFHHKCQSLMSAVGLDDYCLDINDLNGDQLVERFCNLTANAHELVPLISRKVKEFRGCLDRQYEVLLKT